MGPKLKESSFFSETLETRKFLFKEQNSFNLKRDVEAILNL